MLKKTDDIVEEFKALVIKMPSRKHPWVTSVEQGLFTKEQIIKGELQHYLSVISRAKIYTTTLWKAIRQSDDEIVRFAAETVREELTGQITHADVLYGLLAEFGISKCDALREIPTPGTKEGIRRLNDELESLSAIECIAMMALPEWEYGGEDGIAATIGKAYKKLGFPEQARKTFNLHSEVDVLHGNAYFSILAKYIQKNPESKEQIFRAMKKGHDAFIFERDGQYQAATGDHNFHWQNN